MNPTVTANPSRPRQTPCASITSTTWRSTDYVGPLRLIPKLSPDKLEPGLSAVPVHYALLMPVPYVLFFVFLFLPYFLFCCVPCVCRVCCSHSHPGLFVFCCISSAGRLPFRTYFYAVFASRRPSPKLYRFGVEPSRSKECHLTGPLAGHKHCKRLKHTANTTPRLLHFSSLHSVCYFFYFCFSFGLYRGKEREMCTTLYTVLHYPT